MDKPSSNKKAVEEALEEAAIHHGSDAYKAFVKLLSALDDCYGEDLKSCSLESVHKKQGAAKQCQLLVNALTGDVRAAPKV